MLGFAIPKDERIILENANTLIHDLKKDQLHMLGAAVDDQGKIWVCRDIQPNVEHTKMILVWHWQQYDALTTQRIDSIQKTPITNLQTYYQIGQRLQGMNVLMTQMGMCILGCYERLEAMACNPTLHEVDDENDIGSDDSSSDDESNDSISFMIHQVLPAVLNVLNQRGALEVVGHASVPAPQVSDFLTLKRKILASSIRLNAVQGKLFLGDTTFFGYLPNSPFISHHSYPKGLTISQCKVNGIQLVVKAEFRLNEPISPVKPFFKDVVSFKCKNGSEMIPFCMKVYPAWLPINIPVILPENDLSACQYGAQDRLKALSEFFLPSSIRYRKASLVVTLQGNDSTLHSQLALPFFQIAIELGLMHQFDRIVVYAPFDRSAKLYSMGFRSFDEDIPSVKEQEEKVKKAMDERQAIPLWSHSVNKIKALGNRLFRAFFFELCDIEETPVYLPENGVCTTYQNLIQQGRIFSLQQHVEGVLPEIGGFSYHSYSPSFNSIRNR